MRIMIDANVLISAALKADSTSNYAYVKAASYPNKGLICEQIIEEMTRVMETKFPHRLESLKRFLNIALLSLELVPIPKNRLRTESKIRDINDRKIYRAAVAGKADILLTGDKDLLEAGIIHPKILTPTAFLSNDFK
jgi:putative PIN family toxin of toxin-antitoxin system